VGSAVGEVGSNDIDDGHRKFGSVMQLEQQSIDPNSVKGRANVKVGKNEVLIGLPGIVGKLNSGCELFVAAQVMPVSRLGW
jgi:hypothetical protein